MRYFAFAVIIDIALTSINKYHYPCSNKPLYDAARRALDFFGLNRLFFCSFFPFSYFFYFLFFLSSSLHKNQAKVNESETFLPSQVKILLFDFLPQFSEVSSQ